MRNEKTTSRGCVAVLAVMLLCGLDPALQAQPPGVSTGTARIAGRIQPTPGMASIQDSTVLAYHLSMEKLYSSAPIDSNGKFDLSGLPYGYYDLAVDTPQGIFAANQVINVPPGAKFAASFNLVPAAAGTQLASREFRGSEKPVVGVAEFERRLSGREYWSSPKGVAILAGAGGLALLALASGGDEAASPFQP